jgi:hypothetical protein
MVLAALARLAPLHQRPLLLYDGPGVGADEPLDAPYRGRGPVGEEVVPGELVGLALHRVLGRLVLLPHDDDHEGQQHGVGDPEERVDKVGDVVVFLPQRQEEPPRPPRKTGMMTVRMTDSVVANVSLPLNSLFGGSRECILGHSDKLQKSSGMTSLAKRSTISGS